MGNEQVAIDLKSSLATLATYSRLATLTILVGIVIEFFAIFVFSKDTSWKERGTLGFATLLIALGLAWEWEISKEEEALANRLERISEESIANANERAAQANLQASEANAKAAEAIRDVATQRTLTARATQRAEEAKLDLAKFKAPRVLTPEQAKSFVQEMSAFKGHKVLIAAISDTAFEPAILAQQISLALKEAGVNAETRPGYIRNLPIRTPGVLVRHTTGNDKGTRFALTITKALNDRGIKAVRIGGLDEETIRRLEKEEGLSRNHENLEFIAISVGEKP